VACQIIKLWPLSSTLFNIDHIKGPVPTFFANDVESVNNTLKANLTRIHADILKINKLFYTPEDLTLKESAGILKRFR